MPQNSAKRPRTDEDGDSALKDIKDEEIWMSDGNIIIAVVDEAQSERHLFKCHRSVLSSRLPVLKEMFEADQLSGASTTLASEHYEGIPIVRLFDEHQDVRQLLGMLYNPSKLPYKWYMRDTMARLGGLMRITKKYEADDIYKHCVTIFQKAWPATLKDWDLRETHVKLIWQEDRHREADYKEWYESEEYDLPEPGAAVTLAYEHGLLSSCAGAFYVLDREYRTPNHFRECGEDNAFPHQLPVEIKGLSNDLLQKFIIGREFLRYTGLELLTRVLPTTTAVIPSKHCRAQGDSSCRKELEAWWKDRLLWVLKTNKKHSTDPLGMLDDLANFTEKSKSINKICILCRMELRAQLLDTRQYLWDMLPAFYGIKAFGDIQHEPHIEPLVTELDKYLYY